MGVLEHLKNNSSTLHIRTMEEIDQLFNELSIKKIPIDNKLDFYIRMSIQKVKLQLYYELKLVDYRRNVNSATKSTFCETVPESKVKDKRKNTSQKKKPQTKLQIEDELNKTNTKEEIIAANRETVAQFHPEPDLNTISPKYKRALLELEHEKEMKERSKKMRFSVVSIPMGGMNKK